MARLFADAGIVCLVPIISPYADDRCQARQRHEQDGLRFVEVFVDTPLDTCIARDSKGLYRRALDGELTDFTGVSAPYEAPEHPDLHLRTDGMDLEHIGGLRDRSVDRHRRKVTEMELTLSAPDNLAQLEAEAVYVIREVAAEFERPVLLFSGGKDSLVMLHLAVKAFRPAKVPFPIMHVDTGQNFDEVIEFRDRIVEQLGLQTDRRVCAAVDRPRTSGRGNRSEGQP